MKYMSFNSSCSYAALANMLQCYGVDTDDRAIALAIDLPYLLSNEDGAYLAGPMLQGGRWFDVYLRPLGLALCETRLAKDAVFSHLQNTTCAMLGVHLHGQDRHAVVYTGMRSGRAVFLNSRHPESNEPDALCYTQDELLARLDDRCMVATLTHCEAQEICHAPLLEQSLVCLRALTDEVDAFCAAPRSRAELTAAVNPLFRPLLVDAVTMLSLIGEDAVRTWLEQVRQAYMPAVFGAQEDGVVLADRLPMQTLHRAIQGYAALIRARLAALRAAAV